MLVYQRVVETLPFSMALLDDRRDRNEDISRETLLCGCEQQLRDVVFSTLFDLFRAIIS